MWIFFCTFKKIYIFVSVWGKKLFFSSNCSVKKILFFFCSQGFFYTPEELPFQNKTIVLKKIKYMFTQLTFLHKYYHLFKVLFKLHKVNTFLNHFCFDVLFFNTFIMKVKGGRSTSDCSPLLFFRLI